ELAGWLALRSLDDVEFSRCEAGIQICAYLAKGDSAHAAAEAVTDQRPLINDGLAFEVFVAAKGQRLAHAVKRVDGLFLMLEALPRCADDRFGLVSEV